MQIDIQRHVDIQRQVSVEWLTERQTHRQMDGQTDRWTDRRQTDRQTDRHIMYIHTVFPRIVRARSINFTVCVMRGQFEGALYSRAWSNSSRAVY